MFQQQMQLACEEASRVAVKEMRARLNQEWRQQIMVMEQKLEEYRNTVVQHENRLQGELQNANAVLAQTSGALERMGVAETDDL